eukprot:363369-Chlamydomonas_euryale.AAC.9
MKWCAPIVYMALCSRIVHQQIVNKLAVPGIIKPIQCLPTVHASSCGQNPLNAHTRLARRGLIHGRGSLRSAATALNLPSIRRCRAQLLTFYREDARFAAMVRRCTFEGDATPPSPLRTQRLHHACETRCKSSACSWSSLAAAPHLACNAARPLAV